MRKIPPNASFDSALTLALFVVVIFDDLPMPA